MSLNHLLGQNAPQSKFNLHHDLITDHLDSLRESGSLYAPQVEALQSLKRHFATRGPNIALVVLPTGAGKSGIAVLAPYVLNSSRVLIITPSAIISNQLFQDMCGPEDQNFFVKRRLATADTLPDFVEMAFCAPSLSDTNRTIHNFRMHRLVIANAHKFGSNSGFDMSLLPRDLFDTVIVDEAHHYPAATWRGIVDHFQNSKRVFLTATPTHRGQNILGASMDDQNTRFLVYQLDRPRAVELGLIRELRFCEVVSGDPSEARDVCAALNYPEQLSAEIGRILAVLKTLRDVLAQHDSIHNTVIHQAMILCTTVDEVDRAAAVANLLMGASPSLPYAVPYHGASKNGFLRFCTPTSDPSMPRILVVCGKALEGFDRRQITAVGILRNISSSSTVLFSQFVGRCVRRMGPSDTCVATVVSHYDHQQQENFNRLDVLADVDPVDE